MTNKTRNIIYLRSVIDNIPDEFITRIQTDTSCSIDVCNSWQGLMARLSVLASYSTLPTAIIIDSFSMKSQKFTIAEAVSMISTLYRSSLDPEAMCIAIVINGTCDSSFIKEIRTENDIIGIIPTPKNFSSDCSLYAINEVLNGQTHWPPAVLQKFRTCVASVHPVGIHLTHRQDEVFNFICDRGLSNKKIALLMKISESTVKSHVSAILKQYGVRTRTQLVLFSKPKNATSTDVCPMKLLSFNPPVPL